MIAEKTPSGNYRYRFTIDHLRICFTSKEMLSDTDAVRRAAEVFSKKSNGKWSAQYYIKKIGNRSKKGTKPLQTLSYEDKVAEWGRSPGNSFVYFISDGRGAFKVGKAVNAESRLRELQTCNPYKLEIIALIEYEGHLANHGERFWQEIFSTKAEPLMGEWFKGSKETVLKTIDMYWNCEMFGRRKKLSQER